MISAISKDKKFKVELVNLGEGISGDFDENDPEDVNLLRFDTYISVDGKWEPMDDGSYCTQVDATTPKKQLSKVAQHIANAYAEHSDHSPKKIGEQMSWISAYCFPQV